jgi:uncharacterized protein (DUF1015 family)
MARIDPFRAWRYDGARVPQQNAVTQPYDKISPELQEKYYASSPYNLVRIILGKRESGDNESENVYTRAAAYLRKWRSEGVLSQDAEPSIYVYSQKFTEPGTHNTRERRGFIALGKVYDYADNVVFRHEQTLAKPKADRLDLLRSTRAHFGQIFMLYTDPENKVERALKPAGEPDIDVRDEYGVQHRVWKVSDPAAIHAAQQAMADKKLIIADGHHRYETSLNYRNERRKAAQAQGAAQQAGSSGGGVATATEVSEAAYERVMMTFVNMDSEGLVILPTHRVVHGLEGFDAQQMLERAKEYFDVEAAPQDPAQLTAKLSEARRDRTTIAAVTSTGAFLLHLRPGATESAAQLKGFSPRQRKLDVVQLHKVLLEGVLGISEEDIRNQKNVSYHREGKEALERVQKGANVAFLMNPVKIEQMKEIAFAGEVLPQKSTDFFPKMLSGLTIYALE